MTAGGYVAAAEVADHGDTRQLGQQRRVADLHRETARWFMANGLAMAANRADIVRDEVLLSEEGIDALCRELYPVLLGDGGAGNLVRTAGTQAKQLCTQGIGHGDVVRGDQPDRRGLLDQRDVQAIKAGPGHHTYIKRHDLTLGRSQLSGFFLVHARHQRLALCQEACALGFGDRIGHRDFLAQRVDVHAIHLELVMQVRTGG
ncbi:hypothetical protein D9M69_517410 [compost metagenome]